MSDESLFERTTCSALLITCSDFRFKSGERAFAEAAGLRDDHDLIARPGAIRSLVAPMSDALRATLEQEIAMMWKLHAFTRVLMANHMTCGAYRDLVAGGEDERALHARHLAAAAPEVERLCPGARAEAYVVEVVGGEVRVARVNS